MGRRAKLTTRRLIERLGERAALALLTEWGGHRLPRLSPLHVKQRERNQRIIARVMTHGTTYRLVAVEFGLSEQRIKQIAALPE